jgi:hypothetical protein
MHALGTLYMFGHTNMKSWSLSQNACCPWQAARPAHTQSHPQPPGIYSSHAFVARDLNARAPALPEKQLMRSFLSCVCRRCHECSATPTTTHACNRVSPRASQNNVVPRQGTWSRRRCLREGWGLHLVLLPKRQRCRFKQPDSGGRTAKRTCVDERVRECVSASGHFFKPRGIARVAGLSPSSLALLPHTP